MARSERKNLTGLTFGNTTNYVESFDITNFSGVAVTVKSKNGSTSGTVKLQYTNINPVTVVDADWTDVPTTIAAASVALVANGSATIASIAGVHAGFVRAVVTLSAGADTDYEVYYLAKDF